MKSLFAITAFILSMNAFSANLKATVKESFCGEIDPFAVGDACLVYLETKTNQKLALLMDFDHFQNEYLENELKDQAVIINTDLLTNLSGDVLAELRSMDSSYYYQEAQLDALSLVNNSEMDQFLRKIGSGYFSIGSLPNGYSTSQLELKDFRFKKNFKKWLRQEKQEKLELWKDLVLNSGEYDYLSSEERELALSNPEQYLGVSHLLEIYEVFELKKGTKIIGYYLEISDHVQAAEYQDGAWMEVLLNLEQKIVRKTDESA